MTGEATAIMAYFCLKDSQFEAAVQLINQAALYEPRAPLVHWTTAVTLHYRFRDFVQASHAFARAISVAPGFAYPYFSMGVLASDGGDDAKGAELFTRCLALDPNHHYAISSRISALGQTSVQALAEYQLSLIHI